MARKEVTIFNISFLDLISGALGAVIILYIIIPKLNAEDIDLLDDLKVLNEQSQTIEQMLNDLENSIPKEVFEEIESQMENLRNEIEKLQQNIANLTSQVENLQQELAECKKESEQLQRQVEELQQQLADCEQERDRLQQENAKLSAENQQLEQENEQLQSQVSATSQLLADCKDDLANSNFMLVSVRWETAKHDVDLWVIDPNGKKFYYKKTSHSGIRGELFEDDKYGPGAEVFQVMQAYPGEYKLYYHFYARSGRRGESGNFAEDPLVTGYVFYRKGARELPKITLRSAGENVPAVYVLTITVNADGSIDF